MAQDLVHGWGRTWQFSSLGLSSICNILSAIKLAKQQGLGPDAAIITVATDGAAMYLTERDKILARDFAGGFDEAAAAETFGRFVLGTGTENLLELTPADRERVFNLGYYTWVEQQGIPLSAFEARRGQDFWRGIRTLLDEWDELIIEFNELAAGG